MSEAIFGAEALRTRKARNSEALRPFNFTLLSPGLMARVLSKVTIDLIDLGDYGRRKQWGLGSGFGDIPPYFPPAEPLQTKWSCFLAAQENSDKP